ncbi:MAG: sigma 54-interacting transcriptional regulator, partial [Desulfobacterales bacterium]
KIGRFQEADGGSIFLDEIGDLPLALQAKLLRVLEDMEFYRLGSRHTIKVNVRIISATNRNLEKLVKKRLFREDLYYRLNVFRINLPALKERKVDIPLLIGHILRRLCTARGARQPEVSEKVMEILLNYAYPGNVRELENILEHALIICQKESIQPRHLPEYLQTRQVRPKPPLPERQKHIEISDEAERDTIITMLEQYNWHRSKTAKALGMDRSTLWRKIKKYGIVN